MGADSRGVIFPSNDAYYSESFELIKDLGIVSVTGLKDGDIASVEIYMGDYCAGDWIPFAPSCCGQMSITNPKNQMYFAIPNKYRLVLSNVNDDHLNDPSWFEDVKMYYQIVDSDLDLSNLIKGECEMACMEPAAPSVAQADFDGIKIGSHTAGGVTTEFDMPIVKRNGVSLPIMIDPDTGKACIDIEDQVDANTDTSVRILSVTEANGVRTTCWEEFDVISGTGTGVSAFCIESDLDTTIPNTDTFGTWNGTNITFPDGTVYTPVPDTAGTWDGTNITFPDGTVYTPAPDTNTFGTWNGTNITFPDGTVFTPSADVDTFGTYNGTNIVFPDGTTYSPRITTMVQNDNNGRINYTNEDNVTTTADVISSDAENSIRVGSDGGAFLPLKKGCSEEFFNPNNDVIINPFSRRFSFVAVEGPVTLNDAALQALAGTGATVVQTVRATITNNDPLECDWNLIGQMYGLIQGQLITGNSINVSLRNDVTDDVEFTGAPFVRFDTRGNTAGVVVDDAETVNRIALFPLAFGATATIAMNVQITVPGSYVADPNNEIIISNPRVLLLSTR